MLAIESMPDKAIWIQLVEDSISVVLLASCEDHDLEILAHFFDET